MIVVEGPDGAGKTTLINKLSEQFSLPVAPRVVTKGAEAMVDLKTWTEDNVARGWQSTLFDRHRLISEPIYGSVLRKRAEPGFGDPFWLFSMYRMFYMHCRPIIIYCLPPFQVVQEHVMADTENQPEKVRTQIAKLYMLYSAKAASDAVLANALIYDYTTTNERQLFRTIELGVERMFHV